MIHHLVVPTLLYTCEYIGKLIYLRTSKSYSHYFHSPPSLCLMTQPINHLNITHLAVYVPNDDEKKNPSLYANNVRQKMARELGVECYDLTWSDKLRFESTAMARELGNRRLAAKNGGVVPPMPVFTQDAFGNPLILEEGSESLKTKVA